MFGRKPSSYENWKMLKAIIACIAISSFIYIIKFHCVFSWFLIYTLVTLAIFFTLRVREDIFFPQWKGLRWKSTYSAILWFLCVIAFIIFMRNETFKLIFLFVVVVLVLPWLIKAIKDAYYAKKYHLDKYSDENYAYAEKRLDAIYGMDHDSEEYAEMVNKIRYSPIEKLIATNPKAQRKISVYTKEYIKNKERSQD